MTWRREAERILRHADLGTIGKIEPIGPGTDAIVPIVPIVPPSPEQALRSWRLGLSALDPAAPLNGYSAGAWATLCEDAIWLFEAFGRQAARDAWSTADLFGHLPGKPAWGGIADRLRGSRSLVLDGDRVHWRARGVIERFNRGSYPNLVAIWEAVAGVAEAHA